MAPIATASTSNPVPMELDAILRAREEDEEEYSEESAEEEAEALFFMEPDHDKVRTNEDPEAHDYWEAGLTTDTISALKAGNEDHSQKSCYHCSRKGHMQANCPERRKLGAWPWTKRPGPCGNKIIAQKRYGVGRGRGKQSSNRPGTTKRQYAGAQTENFQALQQSDEDFQ